MSYRIDEDARVLDIEVAGASARNALEMSLALLAARPDLWAWDWIVTALEVPDDASVGQIALLAERYAALPRAEAVSALVSRDPNLRFWAEVMDFQFPGRRHQVVADRAEALSLISSRKAAST